MPEKKKQELRGMMKKLAAHYPEKTRSDNYMNTWLEQRPPPEARPLSFLNHDYTLADDMWPSVPIEEVMRRTIRDDGVRSVFLVKRRRTRGQPQPTKMDMPLLAYVNFRRLQGIPELEAAAEWNGAQVMV